MKTADDLIRILEGALKAPQTLGPAITQFQETIWRTPESELVLSPVEEVVLRDLAYDLDYFEVDPTARAQDPSFFGSERALSEIREAIAKLGRATEAPAEEMKDI